MKYTTINELRSKVFSLTDGETIHINLANLSTPFSALDWIKTMVRAGKLIPDVSEIDTNTYDADAVLSGDVIPTICTYFVGKVYALSAQGTQIRPIAEFVNDITLLSKHTFYNDDFLELDFNTQKNFYTYCLLHATEDVCKENIKVMKDAAAKLYFGKLF